MRVPPELIWQALTACFLATSAMATTDDVVRLPPESARRTEPSPEKHVHKARPGDITQVHPHPPSVATNLLRNFTPWEITLVIPRASGQASWLFCAG
jgi:hypothetical protein